MQSKSSIYWDWFPNRKASSSLEFWTGCLCRLLWKLLVGRKYLPVAVCHQAGRQFCWLFGRRVSSLSWHLNVFRTPSQLPTDTCSHSRSSTFQISNFSAFWILTPITSRSKFTFPEFSVHTIRTRLPNALCVNKEFNPPAYTRPAKLEVFGSQGRCFASVLPTYCSGLLDYHSQDIACTKLT